MNVYNAFCREFEKMNEKLGKDQYIVPYLMSSHPGSTMKDAIALAEYIRDLGYMPEQVQDFYPTPGTISTCMYYTGLDPTTMKGGDPSTMKYRDPKNYALVKEALLREGRSDLIGFGEKFLIPPRESRRATDSLSPRGISDSRKSQKSRGSQTAHDSRKPRGNSGKSGSSGRRSGPKKH